MQDHTPQLPLFITAPHDPDLEIPFGYCHCGCGQKTTVPNSNNTLHKRTKGIPVRYISGHQNQFAKRRPLEERFWEKVDKRGPDDCWEWLAGITADGYGSFGAGFPFDGVRSSVKAHRAAYILQNGPIPDGLHCLHKCDNSKCVNPKHLYLGTHQDNMDDRKKRNRHARLRGEENPNARLSEDEVREIRRLYEMGISIASLADQTKMTGTNIHAIVHRKIWIHI